jgi:hypothetical protein
MDIEPTTKTPIEPDQSNSQDDDIDIPDLVDILSWVSKYFKFSSNDIDIKMIKMALKKFKKLSRIKMYLQNHHQNVRSWQSSMFSISKKVAYCYTVAFPSL